MPGLAVSGPDTNDAMSDTWRGGYTAEAFVTAGVSEGALANAVSEYVTRFRTHRDIDTSGGWKALRWRSRRAGWRLTPWSRSLDR
ncbi:hypothetical protein JCM17092_19280 [Haloplanus litoreus]